jgi:hypothetical protein
MTDPNFHLCPKASSLFVEWNDLLDEIDKTNGVDKIADLTKQVNAAWLAHQGNRAQCPECTKVRKNET